MKAATSRVLSLGSRSLRRTAPHRSITLASELSEEHAMIRDMAKTFAEEQLYPVAGDLDVTHRYPKQQVDEIGKLGLMGIAVSEDYGGSGMDYMAYTLALEEISRGCASTGVRCSLFLFPLALAPSFPSPASLSPKGIHE